MKYFTEYICHRKKIVGKRKKVDNNIYTFDIETTSYVVLDNKIYSGIEYDNFTEEEKEKCEKKACMYEWTFSINDDVFYGRKWEEFIFFLREIENVVPEKKIIFVHNLAFEFQFFKSYFNFDDVMARKAHKVMKAILTDFNIEFRCSYFMSNCGLDRLAELYNLHIKKLKGDLDYTKLRHSETILTKKELEYCEHDCLVVYYYILEELKTYERVDRIPLTSTGHVRRELKEQVQFDNYYKSIVNTAISINPHIYNLLCQSFMGGFTHANYIYTDEIIKNVVSYDFTSSYPYVMISEKYPMTEFKKASIQRKEDMKKFFAYVFVVKFKNVKSRYFTSYISSSKCRNLKKAKYDNGRIIEAEEFEMTLTDIDFKLILDMYECEYEIVESYYSIYKYLPKKFINFILEKYVNKTQFKGVVGKELQYIKEKNKFNSLYGMTVTNTIKDKVEFKNENKEWFTTSLSNEEIEDALKEEKSKSFLCFSWGVWVTAYARNNLLRNVIQLDDYAIYCDTDSIKLKEGFNQEVIENYNKSVEEKIKKVSDELSIPYEKYAPLDKKEKSHLLGVFDEDAKYLEFITQGAKKYAFIEEIPIENINENLKVLEIDNNKKVAKCMGITVAGVPKKGVNCLNSLEDFKDNLVFDFKNTNKNLLFYTENQEEIIMTDYKGKKAKVTDKSGCCLLPNTYNLKKSLDYAELISDNSSNRAIYKE